MRNSIALITVFSGILRRKDYQVFIRMENIHAKREEAAVNWEKATGIAFEIGKSKLAESRTELFHKAAEYARIRVEWQLSPPDERLRMDERRRLVHNEFIETCEAMSRNMQEEGEDVSWKKELGHDRKEIGDFACYIHLILGLVAR